MSTAEKIVLVVNCPRSLTAPAVRQLRDEYGPDICIDRVDADNAAQLESKVKKWSEKNDVKAVVAIVNDRPHDHKLTEGIVRQNLADVCTVFGYGVNTTVQKLNSRGEFMPINLRRI